jgi:exodeoxyribonuclease V alpha subunit
MTDDAKQIYSVLREELKDDLFEFGFKNPETIQSILDNLFEPQKYRDIPTKKLSKKENSLFEIDNDTLRSKREMYYRNNINSILLSNNKNSIEVNKKYLNKVTDLFKLSEEQSQGVENSIQNQFFILTGGPGTGKTTTAASILFYHLLSGTSANKILIAAPTGRAAGRITESIQNSFKSIINKDKSEIHESVLMNFKATTIHRLLSYSFTKNKFYKNKDNPLVTDLLIIDEASMLSPELFSSVCEALPSTSRFILLGDSYQLPPVDSQKLFLPLLEGKFSEYKPFHKEITYNFRSISSPDLDSFLKSIKKRDLSFVNSANWNFFNEKTKENFFSSLTDNPPKITFVDNSFFLDQFMYENFWISYRDFVLKKNLTAALYKTSREGLWENIVSYQILTSLKKNGRESSNEINELLEKGINKRDWIVPKIMTYNNYNLGIFNGDIGVENNGNYLFSMEGTTRTIPSNTPGIETAFAITVHKAQGSQYENTIVVLPNDPNHELNTNEMLYTAVSRAKKNVMILSTRETIEKAILGERSTNS